MIMPTEMQQKIADFIAQKLLETPKRVLKMDEPIISRGLIDSLNFVDLALFVEVTFGVRLKNSELNTATFDTIEQLASLIAKRQGQ
jgi:acyl carrier protein